MVDGDDRVGVVLAAAEVARDLRLVLLDAVLPHEHEQLVVGGRRLLRVLVDRRLVDEQQLGELRAVAVQLGRGGLDLHPVLARPHARRGVDTRAHVDDAHAAHADGVVALVVAEDRDLDPGVLRRLPDRRALGHGQLAAVDREVDGADLGWCGGGDGHRCATHLLDLVTYSPGCYGQQKVFELRPSQAASGRGRARVVPVDHAVEPLAGERALAPRRPAAVRGSARAGCRPRAQPSRALKRRLAEHDPPCGGLQLSASTSHPPRRRAAPPTGEGSRRRRGGTCRG